jgi:hypothetical protein
LDNWAIGEHAWYGLVARLPPAARTRMPDLEDRRRQIASVYVWTRVTVGEPGFAPRPIEAAQASGRPGKLAANLELRLVETAD